MVCFYNTGRRHQALGNRTPTAVWREGTTGPLGELKSNIQVSLLNI
jgi:hypothetical protein